MPAPQSQRHAENGPGSQKSKPQPKPQMQREPKPPFAQKKLEGTGSEAEMSVKPRYEAPLYKPAGKLDGKVAIVTGGDSGIGRAVAVLYAREGADVAVFYYSHDEDAEETKRAVEGAGRKCLLIKGDVGDAAFCRESVGRVVKELGRLDILVNNAAFQQRCDSIDELSDEQFDHTFKTNIYGYFYMAKACIPHMKPGSAIVATGSETGIFGNKSLLGDERRDPHALAVARERARRQGDPRERRRAGAGLDSAESVRPGVFGREDQGVRQADRDGPPGSAGGDRAGLRVPRVGCRLELHHRPGDRRARRDELMRCSPGRTSLRPALTGEAGRSSVLRLRVSRSALRFSYQRKRSLR